ncbi:MAG: phosphate ABC transporter permease subunit PstC [Anaerolineae bacterium]|nr:phosphate ABC transporter permease subunit PstC [Anaerolineae bacterium]MDW8299936.1 phosphate ABC transporter permease subunit PstC [Anaerolineae bacterium]
MSLEVQAEPSAFRAVTAADRLTRAGEMASLAKRPRPFEDFIRLTLFLCGLVSILTTLSIVVVLSTEAINFFTRYGFRSSAQLLTEPMDAETTIVRVDGRGTQPRVGQVIQINEEDMRIVRIIDPTTYEVERGVLGTKPAPHRAGVTMFLGEQVSIIEFLTGTRWVPQGADFGVLPLLMATLTTSLIAMVIAGPVGLGAAIYLSEYASSKVRAFLKPILEILAAVPTVVYGYFALTLITPLLRNIFYEGGIGSYNQLSAGIAMGIMIIPTIASVSEDALSAVPRSLREGSYGLGATRRETVFRVLLPAALSGILAAFILGVSRAVGETMIVAIASGARPTFTLNPFEAAETMTGHIARISTGDLSFNSVDYNSLFAIGLTLFAVTLVLNLISNLIRRRFREVYQ